jgi:hypothetical protein
MNRESDNAVLSSSRRLVLFPYVEDFMQGLLRLTGKDVRLFQTIYVTLSDSLFIKTP